MCLLEWKAVRKKCEVGRKAEIKGKMAFILAGRQLTQFGSADPANLLKLVHGILIPNNPYS